MLLYFHSIKWDNQVLPTQKLEAMQKNPDIRSSWELPLMQFLSDKNAPSVQVPGCHFQNISVQCQAVISVADVTYKDFLAVACARTATNGNGLLTLPSDGASP